MSGAECSPSANISHSLKSLRPTPLTPREPPPTSPPLPALPPPPPVGGAPTPGAPAVCAGGPVRAPKLLWPRVGWALPRSLERPYCSHPSPPTQQRLRRGHRKGQPPRPPLGARSLRWCALVRAQTQEHSHSWGSGRWEVVLAGRGWGGAAAGAWGPTLRAGVESPSPSGSAWTPKTFLPH